MAEGFIGQILLPGFLALVMVGVGSSLTKDDFRVVLTNPKPIILGLIGQMILLPVIGVSLCFLFNLPPTLAIGMILVACSPGGVSSNVMTFISKADTSLSVTITSISNIAAIFTMPIIFNFTTKILPNSENLIDGHVVNLPFWGTFLRLVLVILLPIIIGLKLKLWKPELCRQFESQLRSYAGIFLVLISLGFLLKERTQLFDAVIAVGLPVTLLNIISILGGVLLGVLGKLPFSQIKTLGIEVGFQNGALAMTVAIGVLNNPQMAVPAVLYGGPMFVNAVLFIYMANYLVNRFSSLGIKET